MAQLHDVVKLRPLGPEDAPAVYRAVDSSRAALRRWMVWYRDDYSLTDAESWIQHTVDRAAAGSDFHFAIVTADDALIGVIGIEDVSPRSGRAMVGYWMASGATGRGLGRQAVAHVIAWARRQENIATLWALVAEANVASRRVLEINGFREVERRGWDERGDLQLVYELPLGSP